MASQPLHPSDTRNTRTRRRVVAAIVVVVSVVGGFTTSCGDDGDTVSSDATDGEHVFASSLPTGMTLVHIDLTPAELPYEPMRERALIALAPTASSDPRGSDVISVCSEPGLPDPADRVSWLAAEGTPVSVGDHHGYVVATSQLGWMDCLDNFAQAVVWQEGSMVLAVAGHHQPRAGSSELADDRLLQVAESLSVSGSTVEVPGRPEGLVEIGRLAAGWHHGPGAIRARVVLPDIVDHWNDQSFELTTRMVTSAERTALLAQLSDDPGRLASEASTAVFDESFGVGRQIELGRGRAGWVGAVTSGVVVAFTADEPGMLAVASASTGSEGSERLPTASQMVAILSSLGKVSLRDVTRRADAGAGLFYDRRVDRALADAGGGDGSDVVWSGTDDDDRVAVVSNVAGGLQWLRFVRDTGSTETVALPMTSPFGAGSHAVLDGHQPARPLLQDILVTADDGVSIMVTVAGAKARPVTMRPLEAGRQWGWLSLDDAALTQPKVVAAAVTVVATRDGVEIGRVVSKAVNFSIADQPPAPLVSPLDARELFPAGA